MRPISKAQVVRRGAERPTCDAAQRKPQGVRVIYGYNTLFAEGLYRFAQIVQDLRRLAFPYCLPGLRAESLRTYVYDNNSATTARDDLEHILRIALASNAEQVNILAHSMGNWVTVETLRQIKISCDFGSDKVGPSSSRRRI